MKRNSVYKPLLFFLALLFTVQLACNLPTQTFNPGGLLTVADPVADMLSRTGPVEWSTWIEQLSGRQPVVINGEAAVISSRYNYAMFTGQANARAFEYVLGQVRQWVPEDQIEIDEYPYADAEHTYTWKNLIVTLPGSSLPNEVIVLSAHLDSIVVREGNALEAAPGADDNATGVATLLEGGAPVQRLSVRAHHQDHLLLRRREQSRGQPRLCAGSSDRLDCRCAQSGHVWFRFQRRSLF